MNMKLLLLQVILMMGMAFPQLAQHPQNAGEREVVRMCKEGEKEVILVKIGDVVFLTSASQVQALISSSENIKRFGSYRSASEEFRQLKEVYGIQEENAVAAVVIEIGDDTVLPEEYARYLKK